MKAKTIKLRIYPNNTFRDRTSSRLSSQGSASYTLGSSLREFPQSIIWICCLTVLFSLISVPTFALEYSSSAGVNFTISPSISVSVSGDLIIDELAPGSQSDSNIVVVNVSTNNVNGYNLSSTVGNNIDTSNIDNSLIHNTTNLVNNSSFSNVFTSLSTSDSLSTLTTPNTWGYSYSINDGSTWSNYSGLPLYTNTGITLSEKYIPSNDNIDFKIAVYADNTQSSGEYTNKINFTAIAFPNPMSLAESYAYFNKTMYKGYYTMQDMNPGICATATDLSEMQVIDVRDDNVYTIAKINENCWMTQNLRTIGIISAEYSNFTGDDFNISDGDLDKTINPNNYNSFDSSKIHDSGNVTNGVWYNFYAATAGTINGTHNSTDATQDICPINWQMPTYNKIQAIIGSTYVSGFKPVIGGVYADGSLAYTGGGHFWSSTTHDTNKTQNRYDLRYYYPSLSINQAARNSGLSLRCIANN